MHPRQTDSTRTGGKGWGIQAGAVRPGLHQRHLLLARDARKECHGRRACRASQHSAVVAATRQDAEVLQPGMFPLLVQADPGPAHSPARSPAGGASQGRSGRAAAAPQASPPSALPSASPRVPLASSAAGQGVTTKPGSMRWNQDCTAAHSCSEKPTSRRPRGPKAGAARTSARVRGSSFWGTVTRLQDKMETNAVRTWSRQSCEREQQLAEAAPGKRRSPPPGRRVHQLAAAGRHRRSNLQHLSPEVHCMTTGRGWRC